MPTNCINKQQKFYSLPKRYKQIGRFEQRPLIRRELVCGGGGGGVGESTRVYIQVNKLN